MKFPKSAIQYILWYLRLKNCNELKLRYADAVFPLQNLLLTPACNDYDLLLIEHLGSKLVYKPEDVVFDPPSFAQQQIKITPQLLLQFYRLHFSKEGCKPIAECYQWRREEVKDKWKVDWDNPLLIPLEQLMAIGNRKKYLKKIQKEHPY